MSQRQRIDHQRFIKTRTIEAAFVEEMVEKAYHDRTEENRRRSEWAQRKFLEKYHHNWREFLPNQEREI